MKSESAESSKPSPTEQGSAEILDFLYVDRARISSLYAQLFPQGILTTVKTTAQQNSTDDSNIGTDVKFFKAESKTIDAATEGIEHQFDASWVVPLDVLEQLKKLSLIRTSIKDAGLGAPILTDCHFRLIDFSSMENMWGPAVKIFLASGDAPQGVIPEVAPTLAEVLKAVPAVVHGHFITADAFLWGSLQPSSLTIPITDLILKYGGTVSGVWKLLYILDAWPDEAQPPDFSGWSGGQFIDGVLSAMHGMRMMMGRPAGWIGITPLMIFRTMRGWLPEHPAHITPKK